ncbi:MAG: phosphoribosylformylglycinamidine synthase subunit PurQ [Planctomycetota bacterium]
MTPQTLILRTAGTNCDRELAHAFELAGADTTTLHLYTLIEDPRKLEAFDLIGFPGGFSYGDDIAAGRILANRLKHRLYEPLLAAIDRGVPMFGPCNGFQVLVKLGLLPDPHAGGQEVTLAHNTSGRFIDKWTSVSVDVDSQCIWTKGLGDHELPIAHGEGRFTAPPEVLDRIEANGQVALRYGVSGGTFGGTSGGTSGGNPNGSARDIAGVCDPTGLVFGLMPHPERFLHPTNHPQWTRRGEAFLDETPTGLRYFQNAVEHVRARHGGAVSA